MDKIDTYTPTNFRKNIYHLLNQVSHNKDVKITLKPADNGANTDILVINQNKALRILNKLHQLEKNELARKIDLMSSQISRDNPVFTNAHDFEKWCEKTDD